ncbi:MAG: type II CAAX endopeptidase family protein [Thermodesulfobacteriota bacterium]
MRQGTIDSRTTIDGDNGTEPEAPIKPTPWGFWPTSGLSLAVILGSFIFQFLIATFLFIALKILDPTLDLNDKTQTQPIAGSGLIVSITTILFVPMSIVLIAFFVRLRGGFSIGGYLGSREFKLTSMLKWLGVMIGFLIIYGYLNHVLDRGIQEYWVNVHETVFVHPLLWVAMIVAAPLYEELLFRGFMFRGFASSPIRGPGAVVLTSLVWALHHIQYDRLDMLNIFVLGLILGTTRLKTGSVRLTIILHATWNMLAVAQMELFFHFNP